MTKKRKNIFWISLFLIIVCITIVWFAHPLFNNTDSKNLYDSISPGKQLTTEQLDSTRKKDSAFIKASTIDKDSNDNVIRVSNPEDLKIDYQINNRS